MSTLLKAGRMDTLRTELASHKLRAEFYFSIGDVTEALTYTERAERTAEHILTITGTDPREHLSTERCTAILADFNTRP